MSPSVSVRSLLLVAPSGAARDRGEPWETQAACREAPNPDIFFPLTGSEQEIAEAMAYCEVCPVTAQCAARKAELRTRSGIWGGVYIPQPRAGRKAARGRSRWTAEEDAALRQATQDGVDPESVLTGRSSEAIRVRQIALGITTRQRTMWSEAELGLLRSGLSSSEVANLTGRTLRAVNEARRRHQISAPEANS